MSVDMAIAKTTYATDAGGEIQALRQLLKAVEQEGVLVQADALHANRPFFSTLPAQRRVPNRRQTRTLQRVSADP
jgi:hypothetical protein